MSTTNIAQKRKANNDIVAYRTGTLYYAAKTRAKNKNLDFTITKKWIKDKLLLGTCEATGFKFIYTMYGDLNKDTCNSYAPSLDRIDPTKGYTVDNVQVTILAFNKFKSDMVQHEVIAIAKAIIAYHISKRQLMVFS